MRKTHGIVDSGLSGVGSVLMTFAKLYGGIALVALAIWLLFSHPLPLLTIAGAIACVFGCYCMWIAFNAWDRDGPAGEAERERAALNLGNRVQGTNTGSPR